MATEETALTIHRTWRDLLLCSPRWCYIGSLMLRALWETSIVAPVHFIARSEEYSIRLIFPGVRGRVHICVFDEYPYTRTVVIAVFDDTGRGTIVDRCILVHAEMVATLRRPAARALFICNGST